MHRECCQDERLRRWSRESTWRLSLLAHFRNIMKPQLPKHGQVVPRLQLRVLHANVGSRTDSALSRKQQGLCAQKRSRVDGPRTPARQRLVGSIKTLCMLIQASREERYHHHVRKTRHTWLFVIRTSVFNTREVLDPSEVHTSPHDVRHGIN